MATTRSALTDEDIRTLVKGATPDERALAARKLCQSMDRAPLSDEDREILAEYLEHGRMIVAEREAAAREERAPDFISLLRASPIEPAAVIKPLRAAGAGR